MNQLSNIQSFMMLAGALLMAAGVGVYVFGGCPWASLVFLAGTLIFTAMHMMQKYMGTSLTLRRLRKIAGFADALFILSALLMVENAYHLLFPYFSKTIDGYNAYVQYIHNNWVVSLLAGAVLTLFSTHRISSELAKEQSKTEGNPNGESKKY